MPRGPKQSKYTYEFYIQHQRPEEYAKDPLIFYQKEKVKEYAESKSLMRIQEKITKRVIKIANIDPPATVLDLGMGCGFASTVLHFNGYRAVGLDLNELFLKYYEIPHLNPMHADMRYFGFKPDSFDLIISISAVQWLLAETKFKRRRRFIRELIESCAYCLKSGGKVVTQFYPKSDEAMKEFGAIISENSSFTGTFIIDNPESPRKRKIYLYLEKI